MNDLLYTGKYPLLDQLISEQEKKEFMASKAIVMAFEALIAGSLRYVYYFVFESMRHKIIPGKWLTYAKLLAGSPLFILWNKLRAR
jgi:hypothetical protein